ncbi:BspA family leucine-rich repeat surface protein [Companilactobacillus sp. HBUAS59544]|uniref:BspA family leucine-rich repeat surface protein n=1 Tax=Companilactobacillus sp. HBUAS59544 TaxID=3109363 RepID=UPI002FF05F5E
MNVRQKISVATAILISSISLLGGQVVKASTVANLADETTTPTNSEKYSGTDGTCQWYISSTDILHIKSGTLAKGALGNTLKLDENKYSNVNFNSVKQDIKGISFDGLVVLPNDSSWLFTGLGNNLQGVSSLTEIANADSLDTSRVTNMSHMFDGLGMLKSIDVSTWDVSQVTDMSYMFSDTGLTDLNLNNWNTSSVTTMKNMFSSTDVDSKLQSLDLSNWNVNSVRDMSAMFMKVDKLKNLDISDWNVTNVQKMVGMFSDASDIKELDFSQWDNHTAKKTGLLLGTNLSRLTLGPNFSLKHTDLGQDLNGNNANQKWLINEKNDDLRIISSKQLLKEKYQGEVISAKNVAIFDIEIPNNLKETIIDKNVKGTIHNGIATLTIKVPDKNGYDSNKHLVSFDVNIDELQSKNGRYVVTLPEKVTYSKAKTTQKNIQYVNQLLATYPDAKSALLFKDNATRSTSRPLFAGTNWKSDKQMKKNGEIYYRVGNNLWVKANDVYTYEKQSLVIMTSDLQQSIFSSQGKKITDRKLASNTKWQADRLAYIKGKTYYRVATNEFIPTGDVTIVR